MALAAWDIVRGYRIAADDTDRELETQARVIAEQTARSVQAIDVVLRHVAAEYKRGRLTRLSPDELHTYLRELSLGLKQIDGFGLYGANGDAIALSWMPSDTTMRKRRRSAGLSGAARRPEGWSWALATSSAPTTACGRCRSGAAWRSRRANSPG